MLVMTMRAGESLSIGPDVKLRVVWIKRSCDQVRIGIEAQQDLRIERLGVVDIRKADEVTGARR